MGMFQIVGAPPSRVPPMSDQDLIVTQFLKALPRRQPAQAGAVGALAEKGPRRPLTALQQLLEGLRKTDGAEESDSRLQGYVFRWVLYNISPDTPEVRKYPTLKHIAMTEAEWAEALKYQEPPQREGLPELPLVPLVAEGFSGLTQRMEQNDAAVRRLEVRATALRATVEKEGKAAREQGERRRQLRKRLFALRKRVLEVSAKVDGVLSDPRLGFTTSHVPERSAEAELAHRLRAERRLFVEPECVQTRLNECADRAAAVRQAGEAAAARVSSMRGFARDTPPCARRCWSARGTRCGSYTTASRTCGRGWMRPMSTW